MRQIHYSVQGEVLDQICAEKRGAGDDVLLETLELNPHLAGLDAVLPIGTPVTLPDVQENVELIELSLWDE